MFFLLELNRIADERIEAALKNDAARRTLHAPWIEDLRKDKPYQPLIDGTALPREVYGWQRLPSNCLFDEHMASLRYTIDGEELPLVALNQLQSPDGEARRKARSRQRWRRPQGQYPAPSR